MSFWVYILRCADKSYYTGHTDNLEDRIAKHKAAEIEGYTSTRLPVRVVFSEEFPTREEALACEQPPSPFENLRVTGAGAQNKTRKIKIQNVRTSLPSTPPGDIELS
jgi:GIY-YIG catalytic domain-containing protein